ncbi:MAG: hypothetical protein INR70_29770 [Parafilimonas terrae]|nr:hypothetical protein [Parafilimonas terrae]
MPTLSDAAGAFLVFAFAAGFYAVLLRLINGAGRGRICPVCLRPASRGDHRRCMPPPGSGP